MPVSYQMGGNMTQYSVKAGVVASEYVIRPSGVLSVPLRAIIAMLQPVLTDAGLAFINLYNNTLHATPRCAPWRVICFWGIEKRAKTLDISGSSLVMPEMEIQGFNKIVAPKSKNTIITGNKTRQGYVLRNTLKLAGYSEK